MTTSGDDDPWWWSSESALTPSSLHEKDLAHDLGRNGGGPGSSSSSAQLLQANLLPGEVVYKYGLSRDMTMEPLQVVLEGLELRRSDTNSLCEQLCASARLVGIMGEVLNSTIVSTGCSIREGSRWARWSEVLTLPFKVSDIPEDAMLELTIWGPPKESFNQEPTRIGYSKFPLFSREGRLRTGKQEIEVYEIDLISLETWTPEKHEQELRRIWCRTTLEYEQEEAQRALAARSKQHWLNRMAEARLKQIRRARRLQITEGAIGILSIELNDYGIPIIYEPEDEEHQMVLISDGGTLHRQLDDPEARILLGGEVTFPDLFFMFRSESFRNVVESKCYAMRRSLTRKSAGDDPLLRPNVDERAKIERILSSLSKPASEDEDLLWKFRHSLVRTSQALTKVLASVKWDNDDEVVQASKLLEKWESAEVCDVLTLLSGAPEFSHPVVRTYAVKVLSGTGDKVLLLYMPQLIQALRYDVAIASGTATEPNETQRQPGPLQRFLVTKCASNEDLASTLHWFLKVECALAKSTNSPSATSEIFFAASAAFKEAIARHPTVARSIQAQDEFVTRIMAAARTAANVSGRHTEKTRVLLAALDQEITLGFSEPIPLAGFPGKRIVRLKKDSARIMKSTTSPAVMDFVIQSSALDSSPSVSAIHASQQLSDAGMEDSTVSVRSGAVQKQQQHPHGPIHSEPSTIRIMFKVGDDLRQDQLIIQLIELMDNIFRENGLDLEMTIYHVLATAPLEGLIEFVPDATPLSKVMNDYGSILAFLKKEEHLYGGRRAVVDRFIRSSAGYAVATYVLGIGDRHLDNIMLRPNGHMFHIDFGYAFGRDPKLFSVLVRISPQMIEAMGAEGEKSFRRHCWEALKSLRGQAALILSVLTLMVDASIPDLSKLQMPSNVLAGVQERLKLGVSDEEAERSLNAVIDTSIGALGPRLNERIHQLAQQWI